MSYPPKPTDPDPSRAEEYELRTPPPNDHQPLAGPSRPKHRTLTLHPSVSTSALLFDAPTQGHPSPRRRRHGSGPQSPAVSRRPHFLQEDGGDAEEVHVPDFGHLLGIDDETEDRFAVAAGMRSTWKKRLYLLMEEPSSGREAFIIHILVTGAILFRCVGSYNLTKILTNPSAVLTTLSTLPAFHTDPSSSKTLFGLDTTLVVLFTIEYIARSLAHSDSFAQYYTWATSFFALLDLIAILPYYIEVARNEDTSILFRFSILRTFRLFRVFRAFKYQSQLLLTIEVMYVAVQRSKDALVALSFFILLVLVFFSTLIYFAERGTWDGNIGAFLDADGDPSLFDSIPQTAWFALVTMSTVGYGDVVPRSMLGKLLTVPLLMFGLLLIALPSFVLGRNFAIVFDTMNQQAPMRMATAENTPRASVEVTPATTATSRQMTPSVTVEDAAAPLLPVSTDQNGHVPLPKRGPSPMPAATRPPAPPRMWDGADGMSDKKGDLTNIKLAKNQLVRVYELRRTALTAGAARTDRLVTTDDRSTRGDAGPAREDHAKGRGRGGEAPSVTRGAICAGRR